MRFTGVQWDSKGGSMGFKGIQRNSKGVKVSQSKSNEFKKEDSKLKAILRESMVVKGI